MEELSESTLVIAIVSKRHCEQAHKKVADNVKNGGQFLMTCNQQASGKKTRWISRNMCQLWPEMTLNYWVIVEWLVLRFSM
jgi:hypothetical protein